MWVVACLEFLDDYKSRGEDWAKLGALTVHRSEADASRGRRDMLEQLLVRKDLVGLEIEGGYGPEGFWEEMARHLKKCPSVPSEEDAAREAAQLLRTCPEDELEAFYEARVNGESVPRRWAVCVRHVEDATRPQTSDESMKSRFDRAELFRIAAGAPIFSSYRRLSHRGFCARPS